MQRLTFKRVNGIKTGYWSPAKKDELITRLAQYEELGFSPEDLKLLIDATCAESIIETMKNRRDR